MKLYFAGAISFLPLVKEVGIKNILVSYFELGKNVTLKNLYNQGFNIMLDSGAYSFAVSERQNRVDFDKYLVDYISFLEKNKKYVESYVELDIDNVVGVEKVKQYRKIMETYNLQPVVVWHPIRGKAAWIQHCKDYARIGFNTIKDVKTAQQVGWLLKQSEKYGAKVHGFGTTKANFMKNNPFYSVDSTSWMSGGRYGSFYYFNGKTLNCLQPDKFKQLFGKQFNLLSYKKLDKWNLIQWKKYADYLEERDNNGN